MLESHTFPEKYNDLSSSMSISPSIVDIIITIKKQLYCVKGQNKNQTKSHCYIVASCEIRWNTLVCSTVAECFKCTNGLLSLDTRCRVCNYFGHFITCSIIRVLSGNFLLYQDIQTEISNTWFSQLNEQTKHFILTYLK